MKSPFGTRLSKGRLPRRKAVALIIVLAFVVLLTVLIVAFFSRAISERQISTASSGQVKVDLLAEGAVNSIIGDLKQEISAGSVVTTGTVTTTGTTYTFCAPATQWDMVPCVSGTTAGAPWLPPNVLKRSAYGQPFYSGTYYNLGTTNYVSVSISGTNGPATTGSSIVTYTPSNRAAMVSSTSASLNGRYVSLDRWNKPLLIPTVSGTATTPQLAGTMADGSAWAYAAPDWVLVDRSGNNPTPAAGSLPGTLKWSPTSSTAVVGRYAYTVYDEGGLLDMNVAGCPPTVTGTLASVKSSLAMADLTQLHDPVTNQQLLIATDINAIITNWRNAATAQQTGNFRDNMLQISATNGFLGVNPVQVSNATDNAFPSRQSLINFLLQNVATTDTNSSTRLQTALQFMGTFSRSLEQPSFSPNPRRPRIINPGTPPPVLSAANGYSGAGKYAGNNDAAGGDDVINVAFPSVRVTGTGFTRMDGSFAQPGEPLVKKRFPLSRLAWITYAGPSATAPSAVQTALLNAGVSQATINAGTAANIYTAFGLTWTGTGSWTYNHNVTNSTGLFIGKLSDATAANREPDFMELLKAAIDVGSLGKAAPNLPIGSDYEYQYVIDNSVDYHVLQIAANLIDQADPDSYPTVLQLQATSTSPVRSIRGVEDLPYFYRFHPFSVVTVLPTMTPVATLSDSNTITIPVGDSISSIYGSGTVTTGTSGGAVSVTLYPAAAGTLTATGSATLFYVPEVWNPHDSNAYLAGLSGKSGISRPSVFRITLDTSDPASTSTWQTSARVSPGIRSTGTNTGISGNPDPTQPISPMITLASSTNSQVAMQFADNGGQLYREPTLLWHPNLPAGSGLGALPGGMSVVEAVTNKRYIGMPLGTCAVCVQVTDTPPGKSGINYVIQGRNINEGPTNFPGSPTSHMYTFRLQYQNSAVTGTNWITYDEKYADNHNLGAPSLVVNKNDTVRWPNALYNNPLKEGDGQLADTSGVHDPLTARFGVGLGYVGLGQSSTTGSGNNPFSQLPGGYVLEPSISGPWNWTMPASFNGAFSLNNFNVIETDRPRTDLGIYINLSNPCMGDSTGNNEQMRWFSGIGFYSGGPYPTTPYQFDGLLSQNNPAIKFKSRDGTVAANLYYEDPDGVARRAMGAYAETSLSTTASSVGLPEVTADAVSNTSVATPLASGQSESRPIILNRPFRSVAEMSYASRGLPWKNIDFFTPESADTTLLDVFSVNELPQTGMVAGKINLNTRQPQVLQAVLAGAYEDEFKNLPASAASITGTASLSGTATGLSALEAANIAQTQVTRTLDHSSAWHGPLANIGELVGRFVMTGTNNGTAATYNDPYIYLQPLFPTPGPEYPPVTTGGTIYYSGLSGALSASDATGSITSTVYSNQNTALIQRGRESAIRPLADCGQTRVWNLMIDVIAQSGRYPQGAADPTKFQVEGEKRYWVHVAIDRYTGAVIDRQVEVVTE